MSHTILRATLRPFVAGLLFLFTGCNYTSPTYLYFLNLCRQEAGVHIYKTVDNVDSIFQMRRPAKLEPHNQPPLYKNRKLVGSVRDAAWGKGFWIEDYPVNFEIPPADGRMPTKTFEEQANAPFTRYKYFEGIDQDNGTTGGYLRLRSEPVLVRPCRTWHCYEETEFRKEQTRVPTRQSRYGYTWTELHPSSFDDQILGIEYKIIDLTTDEVLAVSRDYYMFPTNVSTRSSSAGGICRKSDGTYGPIEPAQLIISVLRPSSTGPRPRVYEAGN